ncbi:phage virion morphogenesis protein [Campylobacter sp. RM16191]|uniref:phage virion morphogenesis protein n=1 Tax=Campylobacter sp. RM16191 TaxID=1705728 RepID=UPI001474F9D9
MPIDIKGIDEIQKKLQTLQKSLDDQQMKTKLNTVGGMIRNSIEESFENEASPFDQKWKPISSATAISYAGGRKKVYAKNGKQRKGFLSKFGAGGSKRILVLSGSLAQRWVVRSDSSSVTVSNNSSNQGFAYGLTHQFGTNKAGRSKNVHIPARPFLPIDSNGNLESRLYKNISDYLSDQIVKSIK